MKFPPITPLLVLCSLRLLAQVEPTVPDTSGQFTLIKRHTETIDETYAGYIDRFKNIAIGEMYRTGIPASITLAQAILESAGGTSELAQQANNHFGIKCGANWHGETYEKLDDDKDTSNNPVKSCFRKYNKVEESFYDHSEFICAPEKSARYGFLFLLDHADYQAWACGLESAGYASDESYAEKLIALIERCSLFRYDHPETLPSDSVQRISRVWQINGVQLVYSRSNERIEDIARLFGLDAAAIARYNDGGYAPGLILPVNSLVFIGEKQKRWRGPHSHHYVEDSQSLFDVSQRYGIQLAALLKRNGLKPGQELFAGEQVRLRGGALFSGTNHRLGKTRAGVDSSSAKEGRD